MHSGSGSVEVLERVEDLCDTHEIVESGVFGSRDLFWVKINVTSFCKSGAGFNIREAGHGGTTWLHASNVRNFVRCAS